VLNADSFFDLGGNYFAPLINNTEYVWEGLKNIKPFLKENLQPNVKELRMGRNLIENDTILYRGKVISRGFEIDNSGKKPVVKMEGEILEGASIVYAGAFLMDEEIFIGENTIIEPTALVKGPAYIGSKSEVRHGAYIRGDVLIGNDCVVGHTTEIKSSVMLGGSKAGHFAYIGDSILGRVNLGAGTKLANLKMTDTKVTLKLNGKTHETGLRKFGAILGDGVETGCNSVTAPGTLLGKNVLLYPNGFARGYYQPGMLIRIRQSYDLVNLEQQ